MTSQQFFVILFLSIMWMQGGDMAMYTYRMEDPVVRESDYIVAPVSTNSSFCLVSAEASSDDRDRIDTR
jgi:hypothetical protein